MRKLSSYGPSLIVLSTAVVVLFAGPQAVWRLTFAQTKARIIQASDRLENTPFLQQVNQAYRDIATLVEPSVVHISTEQSAPHRLSALRRDTPRSSAGSGWIYDDQGHIVTNEHVVKGAQRIQVQLHTGDQWEAEIIGVDKLTDIAVIKIPPGRLHPALRADVNEPVRQGDLIFAFGSPFDFRFSMSSGVVSGMGRSVGVIRDELGRPRGYENFIQVDAAINQGNSGGPLTDFRGRVIGMNIAIVTGPRTSRDEGQFSGVGLAIPLDMIVPVVDQLINDGVVKKGWLGVSVDELSPAMARRVGFTGRGVLVTIVDPLGPALKAGVRDDDVVTHVNEHPVGTVAQLRSVISSMLPGETAELKIWRYDLDLKQAVTMTVAVQLDRLDPLRIAGLLPADQPRDKIEVFGIAGMATSTPQLAEELGVRFRPGVMIMKAVPGSRLDDEIEPGSILVAVMDVPVTSVDELFDHLDHFDLRKGVRVTFLRPGGTLLPHVLKVP